MTDGKILASYPLVTEEKVRLSDTDRQGHVNNVAFAFFLEAGRASFLFEGNDLLAPGCFFVIVTTTIDFIGELNYPGVVTIGTGIEKFGQSSITVRQALFQDGRCASTSQSTMVQVNIARRSAEPLSAHARAVLAAARFG